MDEQGRKIYQLGGNPRVRPYWVRRVVRVVLAAHLRRLLFSSGARGVLASRQHLRARATLAAADFAVAAAAGTFFWNQNHANIDLPLELDITKEILI